MTKTVPGVIHPSYATDHENSGAQAFLSNP
jgi:hypothetical protein